MIKYLLLCLLATSQGIYARPAHSGPAELGSHILIVTPQAEVHLEPSLKYEAVVPNTFIQHLSPLARYAAPHDETYIYVPSGAAVNAVARSAAPSLLEQVRRQDGKQYEQISQQIEQIQGAIQQGSSAVGPQLSEAASAAASAASNAGTGFFPALFPPAASGGASAQKDDKPKADKIEFESVPTVAAGPLLSGAPEGRRFYALTPAVSHVIDVYVGPLSAIRARSIQASELEQETKKLSEGAAASEDSLKTEPLTEFLEKKETVTAFKEPFAIKADSLKEQREQIPESREEKSEEKLADNIKFENKPLEDKKLEDKKFDEKIIEEKKLPEAKFETDAKFEEKKFEEKKVEEQKFEEKKFKEENKFEEKKLTEKKIEETFFKDAAQQQIIQEKAQEMPLLDKLQASEKESAKPELKLPLQELKDQPMQERKELSLAERKEQPIQERKEEAAEELLLKEEKEQPQQKLLLESSQPQQAEPQQAEQQQAEPQQQQKQLFNQEQEFAEKKEIKEKRKEFELKKEELLKLEQEQLLLQESFKKNSIKSTEAELNKLTSETEKEQPSATAQPQQQPQQQQRAASGRVEGLEAVPVQHAHHHHVEEPNQQQKSVVVPGAPVDPLPVVPLLVPQAKVV